jgi:hypothetical protein
MMFSGTNIFGHLSRMYINKKNKEPTQAEVLKEYFDAKEGKKENILQIEQEELMIFKKMQKKDAVTRTKALK